MPDCRLFPNPVVAIIGSFDADCLESFQARAIIAPSFNSQRVLDRMSNPSRMAPRSGGLTVPILTLDLPKTAPPMSCPRVVLTEIRSPYLVPSRCLDLRL